MLLASYLNVKCLYAVSSVINDGSNYQKVKGEKGLTLLCSPFMHMNLNQVCFCFFYILHSSQNFQFIH